MIEVWVYLDKNKHTDHPLLFSRVPVVGDAVIMPGRAKPVPVVRVVHYPTEDHTTTRCLVEIYLEEKK